MQLDVGVVSSCHVLPQCNVAEHYHVGVAERLRWSICWRLLASHEPTHTMLCNRARYAEHHPHPCLPSDHIFVLRHCTLSTGCKSPETKRKKKTTPFGINLMGSQVLQWAVHFASLHMVVLHTAKLTIACDEGCCRVLSKHSYQTSNPSNIQAATWEC